MNLPTNQRLIGLTGGIATGKSTVAAYLHDRHGIPILDADIYARAAVQPPSEILTAIAQRYGTSILLPDGQLDRKALGEIVFANPEEKAWLEGQIHPFVREQFRQQLAQLQGCPIVVLMIPLLFEAGLMHWVTEIWVVACTPSAQLARLMARDHLTAPQAQARITSQMPLAAKIAQADQVLHNDQGGPDLFEQIDQALGG